MADFTNRQLAEIIARSAEKINNSVLKEQKITTQFSETVERLEKERNFLQEKIIEMKTTSIKPDLSELNSFYEKKTEENIKRLNLRLKVPNISLYVWLSSVAMLIISFFALYLAYRKAFTTKAEITEQYRTELLKENAIISIEDKNLFDDMDKFFQKNPNTRDKFVESRGKKN